jgi:hypothetical protein
MISATQFCTTDAIREHLPLDRILRHLALALALVLALCLVLAAVGCLLEPQQDSKTPTFTIGVSSIGGPDQLGGEPNRLQSLMGFVREAEDHL